MAKTKGSQASTKSETASTRATPVLEDHVEVFGSNTDVPKVKTIRSKTNRSGLTLPVSRIQRYLKKGNYANRVGTGAAVYLTAVMEYLVAEVLELAGNAMKDGKKRRINPRHICLAIKNDVELNELIGKACISQGGVIPHINPVLLPVRTTKRKSVDGEQASKTAKSPAKKSKVETKTAKSPAKKAKAEPKKKKQAAAAKKAKKDEENEEQVNEEPEESKEEVSSD